MRLPQSQINLIRTLPQQTQLFLSIFQPQVIFTAQINDSTIGRDARVITYNNASGTYTNIDNGFTMTIGSNFGGDDIGKIRVRSATAATITVSENSNINWANGQWLTVYKYVELWPIFPRIIQDPSNATNTIWYKDYDIAYTNQNTILGTYVDAGPHRAIDLQDQNQIYYTSTGTFNLLGNGLSYSWSFEGGSPATSTSSVPGFVTYNTPGHYVTKLVVSGTSGEVDTTYRYVSVYDQAHPPIQKWTISGPQGSRDEGSYSANIKVYEIIPIQPNAVVVIYKKSWYGNTQINLGGNAENNSNIFFVGYIDKDSISYDYQHSEVSFDAVSITALMKKSSGFAVSVGSKATPAYWYELLDMDSRRALYHYLRWHTTALMFNDFQFIGTDYKIQYFDSNRESMYDALSNYMRDTLIGQVVADRQGKVWMEVEAMAYPNPTGTFGGISMNITNRDWMNQPTIEERLHPDIAYAEYGGIAYSGVVTGTFNAYIGSAPGTAPGFYGGIDNHEGLALAGQTQLNQLVGNVVANKNSPYPTINEDLAFTLTNLDIAPQETVGQHIAKGDTIRNIAIDGLYIPNQMNWRYDGKGYSLLVQTDFKQLVSGLAGETVTIPPVTDVGAGYNVPPINLKVPTLPTLGMPSSITNGITQRVIVHDAFAAGLFYTETFDQAIPAWNVINGGMNSTELLAINNVVVCPNGAIYVAKIGSGSDVFIKRAPYPGGTFITVANATSIDDIFGAGIAGSQFVYAIEADPTQQEEVIFLIGNSLGNDWYHGANLSYTVATGLHGLSDVGRGRGGPTLGIGSSTLWMISVASSGALVVFPQTYASITTRPNALGIQQDRFIRAGTSGKTFHYVDSISPPWIRVGNDNYTTYTDINPVVGTNLEQGAFSYSTYHMKYRMASDGVGSYVLTRGAGGTPIVSIDGCNSFFPISGLTASTAYVWLFAHGFNDGASSEWIACPGDGHVYYNNAGGQGTWADKTSNITAVSPLASLNTVNVLP